MRRLFTLVTGILVILLVCRLVQTSLGRSDAARFTGIALISLFLSWLLGWGLLILGLNLAVIAVYVATTVILYASLVIASALIALQPINR